jgi:DNA-binding PadR family transcriptional regulator
MTTLRSAPNSHLPLTPSVFAILLALADGEKHGYAIMQEARQHTSMGPGTLYGTLDRLLAGGLITETRLSEDKRRRYYQLCGLGREALAAETSRLERAVARARGKGVKTIEVRA